MTTSITRSNLYARQVTLLGEEAQARIERARILVVGVGGLGCPSLQYLASAGVGEIGILDFDKVSLSNLQRQILFTVNDIGRSKVEVAVEYIHKLAPFCKLNALDFPMTSETVGEVISGYDLVLDCTDNFTAKFLLHDVCLMQKKVLIQAAVYQYEGQVLTFDFREGKGPCLRCLWPEQPLDGCTGTCAEVGVMGPLLGVMGSLQASEALKVLAQREHLKNGEVLFMDLYSVGMDVRKFKQNPVCPCCVKKELRPEASIQISLPTDLLEYILIDVRNSEELSNCPFIQGLSSNQRLLHVPLDEIEDFVPEHHNKYLTVCAKGIRSLKACRSLRKIHQNVFSLIGGVEAL